MEFLKEDREVSHDHGRPVRGVIPLSTAAAAAAQARADKEAARKREAKAKDERAREAARKAEEEKLLAKKREAAQAAEALERTQEIKSAYAREAAKIAAEDRAVVAGERPCLRYDYNDVNKASVLPHNMEEREIINATSNKNIVEKSVFKNINLDKYAENEMHGNSNEKTREREARARAQKAREAAREAEEKKMEAIKRAAAEAGEALERTVELKSAQVREAARLAAEKRAGKASHNQSINAAPAPSQSRLPKKETVNATSEKCYLEENCGKHGTDEIHRSIKQEILTSTSGFLKAAGQEKEIVSVMNAGHTLLGRDEEKVTHGKHNRTIMHSATKEENLVCPAGQESKQNLMNDYMKDYRGNQNGTRPKERPTEHSKHGNGSHSAQNDSQQITINIERQGMSRNSSKKEIVSVTGDEKSRSSESLLPRNENQMSQYVEPSKPPKMNDTHMEESKQEDSKRFQSEYYPGDSKAMVVPESHQQYVTDGYRNQHHYTPPTKKNRGSEPFHQHHHSTYPYQGQNHHSNGKKQQTRHKNHHHHTQPQLQQKSGSSRKLICGSCNEKYNLKGKLPRLLYCKHSICTSCIRERTNPDYSITCPYCPIETWNIRNARCCQIDEFLLHLISEETQQDSMKDIEDKSKESSLASSGRRQSYPQHGNNTTEINGTLQSMTKSERVGHNAPIKSPHGSKCLEMGVQPSQYCLVCVVWVCAKCAEAEHMSQKCFLKPLKDQFSEMKQKYDLTGKRTQELLRKSLQILENDCDQENIFHLWVKAALECMDKKQEITKKALKKGRELMRGLTDVMEAMPNVQNLPDALATFLIMDDIAGKVHQWSPSAELSTTYADETTACLRSLMKKTLKSLEVKNGIAEMCASDKSGLLSELRVDGGRFHLHALRKGKPISSEAQALPLQCFVSCQDAASTLVFLDLSWEGKCQGRLYIRLTGDTLRGRQFISLCTGKGGVSFCGTRFHRVWWKGLPGEHVWTGDYDHGDGSGGMAHPLFSKELQILAGREVPISAGLVAGRYEKENLSSIFRIYTREEKEARAEAGFGQVEFGLDVVRKAIKLRNISEVMISDCGLVLEM